MLFGLYFFDDFNDDSLLINDEGLPDNPHVGFPVIFFLTPGTIILKDLLFGVRDQGERKLVLSNEFLMRFFRCRRSPDHFKSLLKEGVIVISQVA